MTLINAEEIVKVWFPTTEEFNEYLKFAKQYRISQEAEIIILNCYDKTISEIEVTRGDICPHCNSQLILKKLYFGTRYCCPQYPTCPGMLKEDLKTKIIINDSTNSWLQRCREEGKKANILITNEMIYQVLREHELKSPMHVLKELANMQIFGKIGWKKTNIRSKLQEQQILKTLINKYGENAVFYQKPIFYNLVTTNKTLYKRPDFLVVLTDAILIIEAKLNEYVKNDEQKQNYITLLSKIFPNKQIRFLWAISDNDEIIFQNDLETCVL